MFSPDYRDTMEATRPSGFTAINDRKLTPPPRYNVLPPERYSETLSYGFSEGTGSAFDEALKDVGLRQEDFPGVDLPRSSLADEAEPSAKQTPIKRSVESDTDTVAVRIPSDMADLDTWSDSDDGSEYSYTNTRRQALELFEHEQPDFCIKNPKKELTRDVRDAFSGTIVEMQFRWWEDALYGY